MQNPRKLCGKCVHAEMSSKQAERADPAKHSTFLRCHSSCRFSLHIPVDGGADPETGCFLLSLEVRFSKLPLGGTLQTLLRLTLPDITSTGKNKSTAYLTSAGNVVGKPIVDSDEASMSVGNKNSSEEAVDAKSDLGNFLLIYICNLHVLNNFLLIYICKKNQLEMPYLSRISKKNYGRKKRNY